MNINIIYRLYIVFCECFCCLSSKKTLNTRPRTTIGWCSCITVFAEGFVSHKLGFRSKIGMRERRGQRNKKYSEIHELPSRKVLCGGTTRHVCLRLNSDIIIMFLLLSLLLSKDYYSNWRVTVNPVWKLWCDVIGYCSGLGLTGPRASANSGISST